MWQTVQDCGKQLTINSRLRQRLEDGFNEYIITEVEFDQYHLQLLTEKDQAAEKLRRVLTCAQLVEHRFEVEVKA